jgi:hypothetical protein
LRFAKLDHGARKRPPKKEVVVAKKTKKIVRREYSKGDEKELRVHAKAKTPTPRFQN